MVSAPSTVRNTLSFKMSGTDQARRKLLKYKKGIDREPIPGVTVTFDQGDVKQWIVEVVAPGDSLYKDDVFTLTMDFSSDWPERPPKLKLLTPIFHPNMHEGAVCIAVMTKDYNDAISPRAIIDDFIDALRHPNPDIDIQLDVVAGWMMREDRNRFEQKAREQVAANCLARMNPDM